MDLMSGISRQILGFVCALILVLNAGCSVLRQPAAGPGAPAVELQPVVVLPIEKRPNIVFILVDDLDQLLNTTEYMPNLQRYLVQEGTRLENFVVSAPICCPSRVTFLTGQYIHNHQVYGNQPPQGGFQEFFASGAENSTIATWLQQAGYYTMFLGKYMNGYPDGDNRTYIPPGWDVWYSPARGQPYTGNNYTMNENGSLVAYGLGEDEYLTDVLAERTLQLLAGRATADDPFFIYLAPYAPHEPATPAPRHAEMFPEIEAPQSPSFNEADVSDKPGRISNDPQFDDAALATINQDYRLRVQSMQAVDEMIGRIVETLAHTGKLADTYILFTSDNGYHLGQHRQVSGKSSPYEEDLRVPFYLRGPGIPAGQVLADFQAGNTDIAPTLAEIAGVIPPGSVDGRSLLPLFAPVTRPEVAQWRQAYLIEFFGFGGGTRLEDGQYLVSQPVFEVGRLPQRPARQTPAVLPQYLGLRTNRYKYIAYQDGFIEVYDLEIDPFELENIAATLDVATLDRLARWLQALSACAGAACVQLENYAP
jgi:arylsulfatase A-like enzyme